LFFYFYVEILEIASWRTSPDFSVIRLSHCHCERKSERDSMRFLWLQSARWFGFPGGTDNYNSDILWESKHVCLRALQT